jgi:hypothetical protein
MVSNLQRPGQQPIVEENIYTDNLRLQAIEETHSEVFMPANVENLPIIRE